MTRLGVESLALARLLHLVSPSLPIGAFTYSQGLEWAVENGWVRDSVSLADWLEGQLSLGLTHTDVPLLARLYGAVQRGDPSEFGHWSAYLLACRETQELRAEERGRGKALATLLPALGIQLPDPWRPGCESCQAAGMALAAVTWAIPLQATALGYAWGWLEGQVLAGVKLIPLGQTAGQRLLHRLGHLLPGLVTRGLAVTDGDLGGALPALAIASSRHEQQYTRLFRS